MFSIAQQILMPLLIALAIGFAGGWLMQRQAVARARTECREALLKLQTLSAQLHAFREQERLMPATDDRLEACESGLLALENELTVMLHALHETRQALDTRASGAMDSAR